MKLRKKHRLFLLAPLFAIVGYAVEPFIFDHQSPDCKPSTAQALPQEEEEASTDLEDSSDAPLPDNSLTEESPEPDTVDQGIEGLFDEEPPADADAAEEEEASEETEETPEEPAVEEPEEEEEEVVVEEPFVSNLTGRVIKPYQFAELEFNGIMSPYVWRNPIPLKKQLASSIQGRLKNLEPETVKEFIKNPESRLLIAQWELLHRVDMEKFAEFSLEEDFRNQLGPLLNNLPWLAGLLYDGETKDLEVTLDMVRHFRVEDPNMDVVGLSEERGDKLRDQFIKRRIAAAVAAEFTNNEWHGTDYWDQREEDHIEMMGMTRLERKKKELADAKKSTTNGAKKEARRLENIDEYAYGLERYKFFAQGVDDRLLNPDFYTMPNWLMRFPCGWNADMYGTIQSMEWLRETNSVPVQEYANIFSQVPYVMYNDFGYNVDDEHYYQAMLSLYPYNHLKQVRDVGGVCVGQAHYAVASASANGIPGFVVSEPNHNSYAIFYEGEWHPCNSGSISRSPKWNFWDDSTWNTLAIYTRLYQDGQKTRDAQLITSIANMLNIYRNETTAIEVYKIALSIQPLLRPTWDAYLEIAKEPLAVNPQKWLEVNAFICELMGKGNPSACSTYLKEKIYPDMMKALKSPRHKMEAFGQFFLCLDEQEENPWDIDSLLETHYATLKDSPALLHEYYSIIAEAISKHPDFGTALTWAVRKAYDRNSNDGKKLLEVIDECRENCEDDLARQKFDAAIVRAAEQISVKRFEDKVALFKKYSEPYMDGLDDMPKLPKIKGNLISDGAMISLSSYKDEAPEMDAYHAAALTEKGGLINSRAWKQESLTIELEELRNIGSIIIVPAGGSAAPYYMWNIQISKDGKKWEQLATLPDNSAKPYIHVHIKSQHPSAKYIKIDSGMSMTQGIQFKAVLIYDNKNR